MLSEGIPKENQTGNTPRPQGRAGIDEDQVFGLFIIDDPARRNAGALRSAAQDAAPGNTRPEDCAQGSAQITA